MNPTQHNPNVSLQQHSNPTLDTISLMKQGFLMMEEDFERGPRYHAYAALRETKLRMKYTRQQEYEQEEEKEGVVEAKVLTLTPPRKKTSQVSRWWYWCGFWEKRVIIFILIFSCGTVCAGFFCCAEEGE